MDVVWFEDQLRRTGVRKSHIASELGVPRSTVSRMVKGERVVSPAELITIARLLQVDLGVAARNMGWPELSNLRPPEPLVPVVGWVGSGGVVKMDSRGILGPRKVVCGSRLDPQPVAALRVQDPGSYLDGAVAFLESLDERPVKPQGLWVVDDLLCFVRKGYGEGEYPATVLLDSQPVSRVVRAGEVGMFVPLLRVGGG